MKKIVSLSAGFALLLSPLLASADTLSDLQAQIQALLAQIVQLKAQMSTSEGTLGQGVACIALTNSLSVDDTDADNNGEVSKLQQFLAQDSSIYPEARVTGYFGPATMRAVQRWQKAHGVVSSGDPDTTGYGFVGARTRAALALGCASNTSTTQANTAPSTYMPPSTPTNPTPGTPTAPTGPNTLIPSTTFMNISLAQGSSNNFTRSIVLTNSTAGTITYTVRVPNQPSWLNVSYNTAPLSLQSGGTASVAVSANANGLAAGSYNTTLVVQGNFSASPINILITLTVTPVTVASTVSASCHGSLYNSGTPGVSWGSSPSGGTGSYTYQWSLSNDVNFINDSLGGLQTSSVMATYGSIGTKNASVVVASGGQSTTANCSTTIAAPAPTLTNITPTSGSTNTTITLGGSNLSGATEVDFYHSNGQLGWTTPSSASNISISANSINVTVSGGAVGVAGPDTYQVKVMTPSGTSNAMSFTLTAPSNTAPTLTNITPTSGTTNTVVTLSGTNLSGATEVDFYNSNGQLGATVPSTATNISISANSISITISGGMVGIAGPDNYQVKVVTPNGTSNGVSFNLAASQ